jgi:hypothetical protein
VHGRMSYESIMEHDVAWRRMRAPGRFSTVACVESGTFRPLRRRQSRPFVITLLRVCGQRSLQRIVQPYSCGEHSSSAHTTPGLVLRSSASNVASLSSTT